MIFAFKELARWFKKNGMHRAGKSPRIMIVCEDEGQRQRMAALLENDLFLERGGFMTAEVPTTVEYRYEGNMSGVPYKIVTERELQVRY